MKMEIYAVFDKQVKAFMQPMFFRTRGEALRSWGEAVNTKDQPFNRNAADYSLHFLGTYTDHDGLFKNVEVNQAFAVEAVAMSEDMIFPPEKRMPM